MIVTVLAPVIGYDLAARVAQHAQRTTAQSNKRL